MDNKNKEAFEVAAYPEGYEKVKQQLLDSSMSDEEKERFMDGLIGFLVKG